MNETTHGEGPRPGSGAMFDRIAPRYDLLNRLNSLGRDRFWRTRAVASLELRPGQRILDLATGTGDVAIEVASAHADVSVVGLDPSREMLTIAEAKTAGRSLAERVSFIGGDATTLPFETESFDRMVMAFGIRNVPDRPRALAEMSRVLKPGGRLAILELATPDHGWLSAAARIYVASVIPAVGALLSGAPEYRYLERSIAAFPPAEQFSATIEQAGFTMERIERLTFGACVLFVAVRKKGT